MSQKIEFTPEEVSSCRNTLKKIEDVSLPFYFKDKTMRSDTVSCLGAIHTKYICARAANIYQSLAELYAVPFQKIMTPSQKAQGYYHQIKDFKEAELEKLAAVLAIEYGEYEEAKIYFEERKTSGVLNAEKEARYGKHQNRISDEKKAIAEGDYIPVLAKKINLPVLQEINQCFKTFHKMEQIILPSYFNTVLSEIKSKKDNQYFESKYLCVLAVELSERHKTKDSLNTFSESLNNGNEVFTQKKQDIKTATQLALSYLDFQSEKNSIRQRLPYQYSPSQFIAKGAGHIIAYRFALSERAKQIY